MSLAIGARGRDPEFGKAGAPSPLPTMLAPGSRDSRTPTALIVDD